MMKPSIALLVAASLFATSLGAIITPSPPGNCTEFLITGGNLGSTPNFIPNLLHYNKFDTMDGTPEGPFFTIGANCTWVPNGRFHCPLNLYADIAHTQFIGTGLMSSQDLILNNDVYHTAGGYMNLTTHITVLLLPNPSNPNAPENRNFKSQSTLVFFQPKVIFPATAPFIANLLSNPPQANTTEVGFLTLWGSSGYDPINDSFVESGRGTGLDFRGRVTCPPIPPTPPMPPSPPIIPGCPCDDPRGVFVVPYSCAANGPVSRSAPGACIQLSFSSGPAVGCSSSLP